eukprot:TRINITY_DN18268_c0_g1_i1.p2 TRINITY_DN18268_c0_g1~~TRINITY_DN18268_c0_g1_i1.p2  ORF type:complete len:181 (-),score=21.43 TRINITY_DN18268_c0_g1_i1:723-1265(-)
MLKGCTTETFAWLLRMEELEAAVQIYDTENKKMVKTRDSLPWPVLLLLGGYNRKHVICKGPPNRRRFYNMIEQTTRRLEWRSLGSFERQWWQIGDKRKQTRPCDSNLVPLEIKAFTACLVREMDIVYQNARKLWRRKVNGETYCTAYTYAMGWLRDANAVPIQTDKEGGYALAAKPKLSE